MITYEEAARMVEAEGRLGRRVVVGEDGLRCVVGVIRNYYRDEFGRLRIGANIGINLEAAMHANDTFAGTPEERTAYMAEWFRAQVGESCLAY